MRRGVLSGLLFLVIGCLSIPCRSFAWGMSGHRIVGEIASSYLTPAAKKEIKKILGNETIAMASNWADFIKADPAYKYLNAWHYINFDSALSYDQMLNYLKKDAGTDAYTKLNFLINELKHKDLGKKQKLQDLRLLIHLVGDMHQPFHSARNGDQGGNDITVFWFGQSTNIHRVWDEHLIDFQKLSYTEYTAAINHVSAKQKAAWQKEPVTKWLFDSYQLSERLHRELQEGEQKLAFEYNLKHADTLNAQLVKGGIHLAALLNQIFS
jgi:hypothetical protein